MGSLPGVAWTNCYVGQTMAYCSPAYLRKISWTRALLSAHVLCRATLAHSPSPPARQVYSQQTVTLKKPFGGGRSKFLSRQFIPQKLKITTSLTFHRPDGLLDHGPLRELVHFSPFPIAFSVTQIYCVWVCGWNSKLLSFIFNKKVSCEVGDVVDFFLQFFKNEHFGKWYFHTHYEKSL